MMVSMVLAYLVFVVGVVIIVGIALIIRKRNDAKEARSASDSKPPESKV
jgi:hypothetical protein